MKKLLLILSVLLIVCSCGGDKGGSGNNGLNHEELAETFIFQLNFEAGRDAEIVEVVTDQWNYLVVIDFDTNTYKAYDLTNYIAGEDIFTFLNTYQDDFYFNLIDEGKDKFRDVESGLVFEETITNSKDLEKLAAFLEAKKVVNAAETIQINYGLSEERSRKIAHVSYNYFKNSQRRSMTPEDANIFSREIIGVDIDNIKSAYKKSLEGRREDLNDLIDDASNFNGISPEHTTKLLEVFFR